jgi:hypothetical protein
MQMTARRFFLLHKHIARLRERRNYDMWLIVNWINITDKDFKEKAFQNMVNTAFSDTEGTATKPYWDNPEPGLKQVK